MKLTIRVDGIEKEIDVAEPKRKHRKQFFKLFSKVDKNEPDAMDELTEFQDNMISELSGLKPEDVENLDIIEAEKILSFITGRFKMFGFEAIKN